MNDKKAQDAAPGTTAPPVVTGPVPPTTSDDRFAALARALGHPARVAIVRMLIESGACVCGRIVERLPLAQATVSQHLKVLKEAGLIRGTIDPPRVCYCIDPEVVKELEALVKDLTGNT